jgi:hypothetical protein
MCAESMRILINKIMRCRDLEDFVKNYKIQGEICFQYKLYLIARLLA